MHRTHRDKADALARRGHTIFLVRLAAAAAAALTLAGAAVAAPTNAKRALPPKPTNPMRVVIVTDGRPGCEPNCAQWISAQGQIVADTPAQFQRVFKALGQKRLPIFISSGGGSVPAALAIGREIRKRWLDVAVERTVFQKCEQTSSPCDLRALTDSEKGRPEPIGANCSSSCVLILAAGLQRVVPVYGFVGVHAHRELQTMRRVWQTFQVQRKFENGRIVEQRKLISEKVLSSATVEKDPNYAPVRAYFNEMGINTETLMLLLQGTRHSDIHRMTPDERRMTRVVTRVAAGDVLLQTAARAADPKDRLLQLMVQAVDAEAGTPKPVAADGSALSNVVTELTLYYPPGGDTVDIFVRVKPTGGPLRTAHFTADVALADGNKLTARGTGGGPADPIYAPLASEQFCTLRRAGDLSSMKISLASTAFPGSPIEMVADLAKVNGAAEFAARRCGK